MVEQMGVQAVEQARVNKLDRTKRQRVLKGCRKEFCETALCFILPNLS